jgi:hypothetical protein
VLDLTMSVWALLATILGFGGDDPGALLLANRTIAAAVGALLVALTPLAPMSFAGDGAWVFVTFLVLDVLIMCAWTAAMLVGFLMNDERSRLTACPTGCRAAAPLSEISFAIDWARDISTHLRLLVLVLVGTFLTTIFGHLRDVEHLGACASAAEVAVLFTIRTRAFMGNLGIACVVLTPVALARDGAILHIANCFLRISVRRIVLAFCTAMQSRCDLDPLAVLHDWFCGHQFSVKAACAALSVLGPLADCRNWARDWLGITRFDLLLILLTAFLATIQSFFGDNEATGLGASRLPSVHSMISARLRALLPLAPMAFARFWAIVRVAGSVVEGSILVRAFLSAIFCRGCHNVDRLCLTTITGTAAI